MVERELSDLDRKVIAYSFGVFTYLFPFMFFLMGVPMVLGVVPPNGTYGVRTERTFASVESWYAINFNVGVAMLVTAVLATVAIQMRQRVFPMSDVKGMLIDIGLSILIMMIAFNIAYQF